MDEPPETARPPVRLSSPDRRRRVRPDLLAAVVLLVLGAVALLVIKGIGRKADGPAATSERESEVTVRTTPSVPADPEHVLESREADWFAVVEAIMDVRTRAYKEGRPEVFDDIYSKECPCNLDGKKGLTDALESGMRPGKGFDPQLLQVDVVQSAGVEAPVGNLRVIHRQGPYDLVDEHGQPADHSEGWTPQSDIWRVAWEEDGRWRVISMAGEGKATELPGGRWGPPTGDGG